MRDEESRDAVGEALVRKAIELGNVKIAPEVEASIGRMLAADPDDESRWDIVTISFHAWGKWERMSWDGKTQLGNRGGFEVQWDTKGAGCGRAQFYTDRDGSLRCMNECMGRDFLKKLLARLVDDCVLDDEPGS